MRDKWKNRIQYQTKRIAKKYRSMYDGRLKFAEKNDNTRLQIPAKEKFRKGYKIDNLMEKQYFLSN